MTGSNARAQERAAILGSWDRRIGTVQAIAPEDISVWVSESLAVFKVDAAIDFRDIEHNHGAHEFVFSFGPDAPFLVDGKEKLTRGQQLFPFNPGQPHHALTRPSAGVLVIFVRSSLVASVAGRDGRPGSLSFRSASSPTPAALGQVLAGFARELDARQPGYNLAAEVSAIQAAGLLLAFLESDASPAQLARLRQRRHTDQAIADAAEFIRAHYRDDLTLGRVASAAHVSPYHLCRRFKASTGMSPFQYLASVKIERARQLLARGSSVTQACFDSGFTDASHFSRAFRQSVGMSPSRFRRQSLR